MSDPKPAAPTPEPAFLTRIDPIHGWPVLYAPPRALRPFHFRPDHSLVCGSDDPFATGREHITTPEVYAIRPEGSAPDEPGWQVRIIPNKYPATADLTGKNRDAIPTSQNRLTAPPEFISHGLHEVLIECPEAETHLSRLSPDQQFRVFRAVRDRFAQLSTLPGLAHAVLFKNQGSSAGASQAHAHSQLIATRLVPPMIRREVDYCRTFRQTHGLNYFDQLITEEEAAGQRIVESTPHYLLCCPAVSRFGLEMLVLPRFAAPHFHNTGDDLLLELSQMLISALHRLERVARDPAFNLVLHTAPFQEAEPTDFRWHWEIYPRIAGIAGYELGVGGFVNAMYPEQAAEWLRQA